MVRSPAAATNALREALTGATLRAVIGVRDAGEAFLARVGNIDGGPVTDTDGSNDVWVHATDELTGQAYLARLFLPGNVLFALPQDGDTCVVIKPRDANGPGMSYLLHGDGGDTQRFPSWIASKIGLYVRKILRLESATDDVEVECPSGHAIKLGAAATRGVARMSDTVDRNFTLATWMTAVEAQLTAAGHPVPTPFAGETIGAISSASTKAKAE